MAGMWVAGSQSSCFLLELVEILGEGDEIVVGTRWWPGEQPADVGSGATRAGGDRRTQGDHFVLARDSSDGLAVRPAEPAPYPGPQGVGGPVARPDPGVHPAVSLDGFRGTHRDGQRFTQNRAEPPAAPHADHDQGDER